MPATRNSDGSVVVDGVTLTAAQVTAINSAAAAPARPLLITTGSGRQYGQNGPPRYGVFFSHLTGKWNFLDKNGSIISNSSWKPKNLSRSKFKFA